jgi:hypothetical protein
MRMRATRPSAWKLLHRQLSSAGAVVLRLLLWWQCSRLSQWPGQLGFEEAVVLPVVVLVLCLALVGETVLMHAGLHAGEHAACMLAGVHMCGRSWRTIVC